MGTAGVTLRPVQTLTIGAEATYLFSLGDDPTALIPVFYARLFL